MIDRLHKSFELLAEFPTIGRVRDEIRPGLRSDAVRKYVVYYLPADDGIHVICVLHGSREIDAELR